MSAIKFALNHLTLGVLWGATVLLGMAPSVQATPPVTNGLVLHMDAAQVTGTASGAQLDTWSDASGLANHAYRQSESSTGYPQYVASVVNGQPVVRFNSVSANIGDYYRFDRITTIRSVFWVLKENAGVSDGRFLLGDSDFSNYHFHRSYANGPLWDGGYSSANVRNGMTKLMGTPINGTTTSLPSGSFQLVSLVTAGDVSANQISQDRTSHGSWQGDIAEILIYNRPLTSTEENEVGAYLAAKYALSTAYVTPVTPAVPTGVAAAPVSSGAIRVSWLGVSGATKYNLSYKTTIGGSEQVVTAISASPFVVSGLSNGSSYDFKVAAVNSAGTSAYSSVVSATPVVSGAKDILAVVFPSQPAATISGTSVSVTVASATDVTSLSPTYTLSANATGSPASGTPRNFTTPQTYTITAEDNSTKVYTMTVSVMPDTLPPITSGLVLRMDASKITGKVNGTQLNTWVNTSGVPNDAIRQSGSSVGFPKYVTGVLNGKPVVRFNSADATGDSFDFSRISNIRSVFWVLKENAGLSDGHFLLGDDSSYQFHRGDSNGALWANNYSDNHIKNGVTRLMGNAIDGTSVSLPSGSFQLVSLVTDGDVQANRICQDRTAHGSWQGDIAEILIYDRALTGAEELQVGSYLSTKYALSTAYPVLVPPLTPTGIAATPVSSGMVSVSWLAVSGATSYNVSYKTTIGGTQQVMNGVSASPTIITGLTDGTLYDFKVMAINAVGASDYSELVTATPKQSSAKDILSAAFGPLGPATLTGTEVKITVAPCVCHGARSDLHDFTVGVH
jgi:Fibronectin type III domain